MADKKEYSGLLSLRITPDLHERISKRAKAENRSVNSYVTLVLEENLKKNLTPSSDNLENRQFVGRVVHSDKINEKNGLVDIDGIYYRFLIDGNHQYDPLLNYVVIEANGNILTLRELND